MPPPVTNRMPTLAVLPHSVLETGFRLSACAAVVPEFTGRARHRRQLACRMWLEQSYRRVSTMIGIKYIIRHQSIYSMSYSASPPNSIHVVRPNRLFITRSEFSNDIRKGSDARLESNREQTSPDQSPSVQFPVCSSVVSNISGIRYARRRAGMATSYSVGVARSARRVAMQ